MNEREHDDPLMREDAWPSAAGPIERIETHISRLYFVGERVYKVKKPVELPFLDYRELADRLHFCQEELRLNRRLAPDVYLRVAPITRGPDGRLRLDGAGETVEWAVEMQRLPARTMLDAVLERGEVDNGLLRRIAQFLVDFHGRCERNDHVSSYVSLAQVLKNAEDNFVALEEHGDGRGSDVLSARMLAHLREATRRAVQDEGLASLFDERQASHRACEGHGDLHAGNLCLLPSGIVAYDCVEFSEAFRCSDTASELAFLAMDLDFRGFRGFSSILAHEYAQRANDRQLLEVLDFYKAYRALVRAKVSAIRASQSGDADARGQAQRYVHLAASYSLPPALILTCGLPASGKTWLARRLATPFEAAHLSSDVRRKILARVPLESHGRHAIDEGLYSPALKERTYDALLASARAFLDPRAAPGASGHEIARTVIVDATFPTPERRAPFRELARELGAPFVLVHAQASEDDTRRRIVRRTADPEAVSDADWNVYLRAAQSFAAPAELERAERVEHASGEQTAEDAAREVLDRIVQQHSAG